MHVIDQVIILFYKLAFMIRVCGIKGCMDVIGLMLKMSRLGLLCFGLRQQFDRYVN